MAWNKFNNVLDECFRMMQKGHATLDSCLDQYPQYADDLRPLLEMALEIENHSPPVANHTAYHVGKQRMLSALAEKRHRQA
ncbi:MAG: hypothetical protein U9O54_02895, partial [Chloroflexota bacterium]|nr:hypothetical protein [Chloroflexota bacterium]